MVHETCLPAQSCSTFVELLRRRASADRDRTAYSFLADAATVTGALTYGELDHQARAIAATLQAFGLAGERALLLYPPGLDYVAALFGCLYAGVVAVPAYPPRRRPAGLSPSSSTPRVRPQSQRA
jgi:acyl-CoA synthetase (AMP-forming)/AMP-acid ligase II